MEETLQHDPKTKHQIKDMLYKHLYGVVENKLKKDIDSLILKNCTVMSYSHKSFIYKGVYYSSEDTLPPRKMNKLASALIPEMDNYIKALEELNNKEIPYVLGFINQTLNATNELHDYLRILPSSVHQPIRDFIASCHCRNKKLTEEEVLLIQQKNQQSIALMKQRMAMNLLIT
jgi:hypothetical protein